MKSAILGAAVAIGFAGMAQGDEVTVTGDSITVLNGDGAVVAEGDATIVIEGDGQITVEGEDATASESANAAASEGGDAASDGDTATAADEDDAAGAAEADVAAGEEAYQSVCRNCHGPRAQGIASYPSLADKDFAYLVDRLQTYRAGERVGPNSMLMIPHARPLSDEDIVDLAAYISTAFD